ncbi:prephenate dehydrogenase/arogenate dehydrogenase family protein [Desulfosporosinus sp. PR]|uniref:prephenate dehydrogenase n=1 Tax=Candidatus Desulfosporosinus nitrosoreducens TaxID=3401928 RepID=UPI0027F1224E|nr:prephenate dehydrogenase/arogenate dehydrogenase family protein [Desulfosporosinus sp. PR]MDQ7096806.1 prephenate dehydrogenase/arogenate dehydrogenase family protein [Desulfosporosinus sp. PR]
MLEHPVQSLTAGWSGLRVPKACIFGLGLIGGSWAGALHHLGWEVTAIDPDEASLREGIRRGWIQEGRPDVPDSLDVDLVILASPLHELIKGFAPWLKRLPPGAIITDVGSIKAEVCRQWQENCLTSDVYFVGGHPMSGSEQSGFLAADQNLFRGYPYVLTPAADCPELVIQKLVELLQSLGAIVEFREPLVHDREVALVSHIPHILAVTLSLAAQDASQNGESVLSLAGRSFRDLTRIADSSPEMWKEIMVRNSAAILEGLTMWEKRIQEFREYLEIGEGEKIAEGFRIAHSIRDGL